MRAVILFSGGLDSTLMLVMAKEKNRECFALSFDYGQRHKVELEYAQKITKHYNIEHKIIQISPAAFGRSSLTTALAPHINRSPNEIATSGIPNTYVPARNTLFLAYAMGQAELIQAHEIYIGCNALDINPYVDCRPAYLRAMQEVVNLGTQEAVEGFAPRLVTPLLLWDKKRIVQEARARQIPLELTWSCYAPNAQQECCLVCDACVLRQEACLL